MLCLQLAPPYDSCNNKTEHAVARAKEEDQVTKPCQPILGGAEMTIINSVHTRRIVKTSGFTRGVCKNRGFY